MIHNECNSSPKIGTMVQKLLARLRLTKYMAELEGSSHSSGKEVFSTVRKESDSVERQYVERASCEHHLQ